MKFSQKQNKEVSNPNFQKGLLNFSIIKLPFLMVLVLVWISCEDVIQIQIDDAQAELVVDAWLTNEVDTQSVRLSWSQSYFDNTNPPPIENANIFLLRGDGTTFEFIDDNNDGYYIWIPTKDESIGKVDDFFTLNIQLEGNRYYANTIMNRVPSIDSISQEFVENEFLHDDGIYVEFFARDFTGTGDAYWIKSFKNGKFLGKASEMNIAFDAGFDLGSQVDGIIFVPPIRALVNELDDDLMDIPWKVGEVSKIEIHSLSHEAFNFLEIARDQIDNGSNGIFSIPLANTRSNIVNNSTGDALLGFFNIAAVSAREIVIE